MQSQQSLPSTSQMQDSPELVDDRDDEALRQALQRRIGSMDDHTRQDGDFDSLTPLAEERLFQRKTDILMPWEVSGFDFIFGGVQCVPLPSQMSEVGASDAINLFPRTTTAEEKDLTEFARRRLRIAQLVDSDDQLRWLALMKLRNLVLAEPHLTTLGSSLMSQSGRMVFERDISSSFKDAFGSKSTATLSKRASSLWKYARWIGENGLGNPLDLRESIIYRYVSSLDGGPATTAETFLQSLRFAINVFGIKDVSMDRLISSRVRGSATRQFATKRPLKQALPLSTTMVKVLEKEAATGPIDKYMTLVAGHLCFCLHASARFGDSQRIERLNVTTCSNMCLVESMSRRHKTAISAERKTRFLPLNALGFGLLEVSWAKNWMVCRAKWNITAESPVALPAFSEVTGQLLARALTTAEATMYLREILCLGGCNREEVQCMTSHSLKVTILTWAAQSCRISFRDRQLMGHHIPKGEASVLIYSREESLRLLSQLYGLLDLVRRGILEPDIPRVARLQKLVARNEGFEDSSSSETDSDEISTSSEETDSEDCESDGCMGDEETYMGLSQAEPPFEKIDVSGIRIHLLSGVTHSLDSDGRLSCGRKLSSNYKIPDERWEFHNLPVCAQCEQVLKARSSAAD